jgi:hypothetical protein
MSAAPATSLRRLVGVALVALAALALVATGAGAQSTGTQVAEPSSFTSTLSVLATPQQVPDGGGEPGAIGTFNLRFDATTETICHSIILRGVTPPFESPAPTATHIHQGPQGTAGPPVWLFPNPAMADDGTLRSEGCQRAAFPADADGFSLAEIEANPAGFYVDTHTTDHTAGSIRGQLRSATPVGGVPAGGGGASGGLSWLVALSGLALTTVAGAGIAARRREHG